MAKLPDIRPEDCAFCKIIRGELPAKIVWLWDDALAFVPRDPVTGDMPDGHVLVIPKAHVTDLHAHLVRRVADDGLALPWTGQAERESMRALHGGYTDGA